MVKAFLKPAVIVTSFDPGSVVSSENMMNTAVRKCFVAIVVLSFVIAAGQPLAAQFPGVSLGTLIQGALKGAGIPTGTPVQAPVQAAAPQGAPQGSPATGSAGLIPVPPQPDYTWETLPAAAGGSGTKGAGSAAAAAAASKAQADTAKALAKDLDPKGAGKPAVPASTYPDGPTALKIAKTRFEASRQAMDAASAVEFARLVTWLPRWDGLFPEPAKATAASYAVSMAITYAGKAHFALAFAGATFALDPASPTAAGNLASAIATAAERLYPGKGREAERSPFLADAEKLYLYALSLTVKAKAWTAASMTPMLNLANLYMDSGSFEKARPLFLAARALDKSSWAAALGLASCYEAVGKSSLAKAVLEDPALEKPAMFAAMAKHDTQVKATETYAELPVESPDVTYEAAIASLSSQELVTAAEFIAGMDQSERNKTRLFVDNLPVRGSYVAPEIRMLAQYSSLEAISKPDGVSALKDFSEAVGMLSGKSAAASYHSSMELAESMGLKVDLGFDLNDAAAHPEKYENYEPNVRVSGVGEVQANAQAMGAGATMAERDLAAGKTASTVALASKIDPFFLILGMNPADYADPSNLLIQRHNLVMHNRKMNAYVGYLYSVNRRTARQIAEIVDNAHRKAYNLDQAEAAEIKRFDKQLADAVDEHNRRYATSRNPPEFNYRPWNIKFHTIHEGYFGQHDTVMATSWTQATQVASVAYLQKVKKNAEGLYYDVFRHVALISDPAVRDKKEKALRQSIEQSVSWALINVVTAFASFTWEDEWDCGCDLYDLAAQREAEQAALDKAEAERIERNRGEKKRFDSGEIPESSPLFAKLDAYGTDLNIPFIPLLSGRISAARTVVRFEAELPLPGSPALSYGFTQSASSGATTHNAGVELSFGGQAGGAEVGAKLKINGSIAVDGKGVVSDYDISGGASISAEGKFGGAEAGFEASATRGCTLSAKAEANLNPLAGAAKEAMGDYIGEDAADMLPTGDEPKKEIWSGEYKL